MVHSKRDQQHVHDILHRVALPADAIALDVGHGTVLSVNALYTLYSTPGVLAMLRK
jgi:hypothetical protein